MAKSRGGVGTECVFRGKKRGKPRRSKKNKYGERRSGRKN